LVFWVFSLQLSALFIGFFLPTAFQSQFLQFRFFLLNFARESIFHLRLFYRCMAHAKDELPGKGERARNEIEGTVIEKQWARKSQ